MSGTQLKNHLIDQFGDDPTRFVAEVCASRERLLGVSGVLCFETVLGADEIKIYFSNLPLFERELAEKGRSELDGVIGELCTLCEPVTMYNNLLKDNRLEKTP